MVKEERIFLFTTRGERPHGPGTTHKPMGWVLQGRLMKRAAPQWIHHGCLGCLTGLRAKGTQTYRRETARDSRITAFWVEVNEESAVRMLGLIVSGA